MLNMKEIKNKIEAILYTTGRYMDVEEISRLCSIESIDDVKQTLKELIKDYSSKEGSLEIIEENNKFKLNINCKI